MTLQAEHFCQMCKLQLLLLLPASTWLYGEKQHSTYYDLPYEDEDEDDEDDGYDDNDDNDDDDDGDDDDGW